VDKARNAPPADTLTLNVSEDAYQGDAQFSVTLGTTGGGGTLDPTQLGYIDDIVNYAATHQGDQGRPRQP